MPHQSQLQKSGQQWARESQAPSRQGQPAGEPASTRGPPQTSSQRTVKPLRGPKPSSQVSQYASYPAIQSRSPKQQQSQKSLNPGEVRHGYAEEFINLLEAGAKISELEDKLPSGEEWDIVSERGKPGMLAWKHKDEKVECRLRRPGQDLEMVFKRGGDILATRAPGSPNKTSNPSISTSQLEKVRERMERKRDKINRKYGRSSSQDSCVSSNGCNTSNNIVGDPVSEKVRNAMKMRSKMMKNMLYNTNRSSSSYSSSTHVNGVKVSDNRSSNSTPDMNNIMNGMMPNWMNSGNSWSQNAHKNAMDHGMRELDKHMKELEKTMKGI